MVTFRQIVIRTIPRSCNHLRHGAYEDWPEEKLFIILETIQ